MSTWCSDGSYFVLCPWCPLLILERVNLVLQAIMESQNNPLAIVNYQDDPDVMLVRGPSFPSCLLGHVSDSPSSHAAMSWCHHTLSMQDCPRWPDFLRCNVIAPPCLGQAELSGAFGWLMQMAAVCAGV